MANDTTVVVAAPVEAKKVSGSKLIRAAFKTAGLDAAAKDIVEAVKRDHNRDVTEALVNNMRHRLRKEKDEKKEARKSRAVPAPQEAPVVVKIDGDRLQSEFDQMLAVKAWAAQVGGLDALEALIGKLKRLAA